MTLGELIREARKERGWNQERLADELGVSKVTVSQWETDKTMPNIIIVKALINILRINPIQYLSIYSGIDLFKYNDN